MRYIDQLDLQGKRVLIRVDFNVPLDNGHITDDNRIQAGVETIQYALDHGASVVVCAHLGSPKGKVVPELSLAPVAARLSELLGLPVPLAPECIGPETEALCAALKPGQALMLENLRFHAEETGKTPEDRGDFGKKLAALADIYVFDAFGVSHRANASVVDVPRAAKVCCAGFLLKKEWRYLGETLSNPEHPYTAVSGGAKVSTKLAVLTHLLGKLDHLIIGGAMANTFLMAQGHDVGASLVEADLVDAAKEILDTAAAKGTALHLPTDVVLGKSVDDTEPLATVDVDSIPKDAIILDIGPKSAAAFARVLAESRTVVWNGPMGLFETPAFVNGTLTVCKAMADNQEAVIIVGGGDTDALVHQAGLTKAFDFISTGGGSFLEFLEGKELPGLKALKECSEK